MICKHCSGMIIMNAFSEGKCKICGTELITGHTPCHEVCSECSSEYGLCVQCGKPIDMNRYVGRFITQHLLCDSYEELVKLLEPLGIKIVDENGYRGIHDILFDLAELYEKIDITEGKL